MKKRSAMLVATGLVLAMLVAGIGFTMGLTGPTADAKKVSVGRSQKPIVHTTTKTITIHEKATAETAGGSVIAYANEGSTGSTSTSSYGDDDAYEHESESSDASEYASEGSGSSSEAGDD